MSRPLPPLAQRNTRVRLLAWVLEDVATGGTLDGGRSEEHVSILNLHHELYCEGSWAELERVMSTLDSGHRVAFCREHVGVRDPFKSTEWQSLVKVALLMPHAIYVPPDVSEAAGYVPAEAKMFQMPQREIRRRVARVA